MFVWLGVWPGNGGPFGDPVDEVVISEAVTCPHSASVRNRSASMDSGLARAVASPSWRRSPRVVSTTYFARVGSPGPGNSSRCCICPVLFNELVVIVFYALLTTMVVTDPSRRTRSVVLPRMRSVTPFLPLFPITIASTSFSSACAVMMFDGIPLRIALVYRTSASLVGPGSNHPPEYIPGIARLRTGSAGRSQIYPRGRSQLQRRLSIVRFHRLQGVFLRT